MCIRDSFLLPILLDLWHPASAENEDNPSFAEKLGSRWHSLENRKQLLIAAAVSAIVFLSLGFLVGAFINFVIGLTYWIVNYQRVILSKVPAIVERSPYLIIFVFGAGFAFCAYGATKILIDTNIAEMFKSDHPLTIAVKVVDENMSGAQNMEIMIDTKQPTE